MILSDNETKVDMLNNRAIAKTVAALIKESEDHPISIGIHGDWGAGKSSILAMVEDEFDEKDGIEYIRFNGWKHQGFEDAKIALMSAIVSELTEKRKLSEKAKDILKKLWKSINWLNVAMMAGSAVFSVSTGLPPIGLLNNILDGLKSAVSDKEKVASTTDAKMFEDNSLAKEFSEFQKSFDALLEASKIKKLVVLIDDLDRCLPEVTIETLEAAHLFMFSKSTAFVIAADEAMIEYAVSSHFPNLLGNSDTKKGFDEYPRRYLEKLIQVPFRIPALGEIESGMYIALLLIGSGLKENDESFIKLLTLAVEQMKKPWENMGFTSEQLQKTLGDKYSTVFSEIEVANQISDILAKNTQGNPRKIKRFINMLLLRKKIAQARGFGDEIKIPELAKMMLAEYYFKDFYTEIAGKTDDLGICQLLAEFEKVLFPQQPEAEKSVSEDQERLKETTKNKSPTIVIGSTNKELDAWLKNSDFSAWAKSEPLLGSTDLRPYFFASKEKEDFFFEQVKSDHLRYLIEKLMSVSMNIATIDSDIKELSIQEATKAFEVLSSKIFKQGNIKYKPKGIDGIRVLVAYHPELEVDLLGLIESFDRKTVGVWICNGWDKCITTDEAKRRWEVYVNNLLKDGNLLIKTALKV